MELKDQLQDDVFATKFMNKKTFGSEEIKLYPYSRRNTYIAILSDEDEPVEFYATDDKNAIAYAKHIWIEQYIESIERIETVHHEVWCQPI